MQRRGWGLTRASRIVIILLVVQHLGLAQVLAVDPVTSGGPDRIHRAPTVAALDADLPLSISTDREREPNATISEQCPGAIPPDPAPLSRRLLRSPPAA
jgi:hypothetical protein